MLTGEDCGFRLFSMLYSDSSGNSFPVKIFAESIDYYKPHAHDQLFEFMIVLEGSVNARLGSFERLMEKDNALITTIVDVHSFFSTEEHNTVLFIQFDHRYFEQEFPYISNWILIADPCEEQIHSNDFKYLRYFMSKTVQDWIAHGNSEVILDDIREMLSFCESVFRSTNMIDRKNDIPENQMEIYYRMDDFIFENYSSQLTLEDLSNQLNCSFHYASHLIKKITGMNFLEFLNHIRVIEAERELVTTDRSIIDIALDYGFTESRSFTRHFRKWYNCTPSEFRESYRFLTDKPENKSVSAAELTSAAVQTKLNKYIREIEKIIEIDLSVKYSCRKLKHPRLVASEGLCSDEPSRDELQAASALIAGAASGELSSVPSADRSEAGAPVFDGKPGLTTSTGIKKAAYWAMDFISKIEWIIRQEGGLIIGKDESGLQICLYNKQPENAEAYMTDITRIRVSGITEDYLFEKTVIDREHGNAFEHWRKLDNPVKLTEHEHKLLNRVSVPGLSFRKLKKGTILDIHEKIPPGGVTLITLRKS